MNTNTQTAVGYLPDERPTFIKLLLYAIQQVIVMFPADMRTLRCNINKEGT